jgi:glycyl-tRNA synthetase
MNIEEMATFCKKKGFVFRSADIYGGLSGFFDYGPLGVQLKNNLKNSWYKFVVRNRSNVVPLDSSIITNPKVWIASGHLDSFGDLVLTTKKTKKKIRADHFIEEKLNISAEGLTAEKINQLIEENNLTYNGEKFEEVKDFNLLFPTKVGADEDSKSVAYLRGETCQNIFTDFKLVMETSRQKLPFGIGQIGKAFRNEISPRDFLFRQREFEQMELEFFINPEKKNCNVLTDKHKELNLQFLSAEIQNKDSTENVSVSIQELITQGKLTEWHAYWLAEMYFWYTKVLKFKPENLQIREHTKKELSHYSSATFDLDYKFPFGFKEILGIANRGCYDLQQHMEHSGEKMEIMDDSTGNKVLPVVIEPSQGLDRLFLAVMFEAYEDNKERGNVVLHFDSKLAPYFCGVFPLVKNKPELLAKAEEVYSLVKEEFSCLYDVSGSVGRRYARADEQGVKIGVTVDFETLDDSAVTLRDRDTCKQIRIKIVDLVSVLKKLENGEDLENLGKVVR